MIYFVLCIVSDEFAVGWFLKLETKLVKPFMVILLMFISKLLLFKRNSVVPAFLENSAIPGSLESLQLSEISQMALMKVFMRNIVAT